MSPGARGWLVRSVLLAGAVVATVPPPAAGQARPRIRVAFELPNRAYHELTPAESTAVALSASSLLAARLQQVLRYADFLASDTAADTLTFALDRLDRAATGPDELWLYARVSGAGVLPHGLRWFLFQKLADYNAARPRVEVLVKDVATKVALQDVSAISSELLSDVPLTNRADVRLDPPGPGWLVPFGRKDLCMDANSTFRVRNRIALDPGSRDIDFTAMASVTLGRKILAVPARAQAEDVAVLRSAGARRVQVLAVYLTRYEADPNICLPATAPGDAALPIGGGPR